MKHGSLFSGIGGFDLASEWMGWENVFHCEIAEFPRKVLHYYWPNSISYENIKETDFTIHRGGIDILTGGFPCQPFSMAGKRKGTEDERHLWPEMLRAIREIQPRWIVGENVFGLVNWDAGLVFEQVQIDLEAEGYEVQAFILPAAAVDAPHKRDRVWFVAYSDNDGGQKNTKRNSKGQRIKIKHESVHLSFITRDNQSDGLNDQPTTGNNGIGQDNQQSRTQRERTFKGFGNQWDATDTNNWGGSNDTIQTRRQKSNELYDTPQNATNTDLHGCNQCDCNDEIDTSQRRVDAQRNSESSNVNGDATNTEQQGLQICSNTGKISSEKRFMGRERSESSTWTTSVDKQPDWQNFPTQSPICGRNDGISTELDGITFSKWRNESIKGYGNAIVPQVVLQIFKAIEEYESQR